MRVSLVVVACGLVAFVGLTSAAPAMAQNSSLPSQDWNSSWGFTSTGEKQLRLLQADLIEKKEAGYYESLGRTTITNNVTYDYSAGRMEVWAAEGGTVRIDNHTGDDIGQNTNVIGSVNSSETRIDVGGDGNSVQVGNEATSQGCQNGSINTDSPNPAGSPTSCN